MTCPTCGQLVVEDERYCSHCLTTLTAVASPSPRPVAAEAPVVDDRQPCQLHPDRPIAGTCTRCGKFICISCEPELATTQRPFCEACRAREVAAAPQGLGGWLILPLIGLALTPLTLVGTIAKTVPLIFKAEGARQGLLAFESVFFVALGIYSVFVLVLFVQRSKRVPQLMLGFFGGRLLFRMVDLGLCAAVGISVTSSLGLYTFGVFIQAIIWIPYFLVSKRVKATFVA